VQEHIWAVAVEDNREHPIPSVSVYWPNKLFPAKERMVGYYILIVRYSLGKNTRRKIRKCSDYGQYEATWYWSSSRLKSCCQYQDGQTLRADEHDKPTIKKQRKRKKE
jgi:hypothetical protein